MSGKAGLQMYTYILEGTIGTPTAQHKVGVLRDERIELSDGDVDVTARDSQGWEEMIGGLRTCNVSGRLVFRPADTHFETLRAAFFNRTQVLMAFADGPLADGDQQNGETGSLTVRSLKGAFRVKEFSIDRNLSDAVMVDVRFSGVREDSTNVMPAWDTDSVTIT